MMPVPWLFRMVESSASLPSPVASLVRIGGRLGTVLAVGSALPEAAVVEACGQGL